MGFSARRGDAPPAFQAFALKSLEIVAASFGISKVNFRLLSFRGKMGSSAVVELRQQWTNFRNVAHMGGFFFGCAERRPKVFLGGVRFCRRETSAFLFSGKIKEQPIHHVDCYFWL